MKFNLFGIEKGDVISITGLAGKTTLMMSLTKHYASKYDKILFTTSTKINVPEDDEFDYSCVGENIPFRFLNQNEKGVYFIGRELIEDNKVKGHDVDVLNTFVPHFDVMIIESDGRNYKPIKGYKRNEPVIITKTTKTIGIINFDCLGKPINEDNVHNLVQFLELTDSTFNDIITLEHLKTLVLKPNGIFKNARGEKILYINKIENVKDVERIKLFLDSFTSSELSTFSRIFYSSLKFNYVREVKF